MTDTSPAFAPEDLTKLTVHLTPRAVEAMDETAERLGDTKTDTVNRALIIYSKLAEMGIGDGLVIARRAGEPMRLVRVPMNSRVRRWLVVLACGLVVTGPVMLVGVLVGRLAGMPGWTAFAVAGAVTAALAAASGALSEPVVSRLQNRFDRRVSADEHTPNGDQHD